MPNYLGLDNPWANPSIFGTDYGAATSDQLSSLISGGQEKIDNPFAAFQNSGVPVAGNNVALPMALSGLLSVLSGANQRNRAMAAGAGSLRQLGYDTNAPWAALNSGSAGPSSAGGAASAAGSMPAADVGKPSGIPGVDEAGVDLIKGFEGRRDHAYSDGSQYSIGYGSKALSPNETLTQPQEDARLRQELGPIEAAIDRIPGAEKLNQVQRDVLTSLAYNAGVGVLQHGKLAQDLAAGNYSAIDKDLMAYNKAGGQELKGLDNRRAAEAALWDNSSKLTSGNIASITAPAGGGQGPAPALPNTSGLVNAQPASLATPQPPTAPTQAQPAAGIQLEGGPSGAAAQPNNPGNMVRTGPTGQQFLAPPKLNIDPQALLRDAMNPNLSPDQRKQASDLLQRNFNIGETKAGGVTYQSAPGVAANPALAGDIKIIQGPDGASYAAIPAADGTWRFQLITQGAFAPPASPGSTTQNPTAPTSQGGTPTSSTGTPIQEMGAGDVSTMGPEGKGNEALQTIRLGQQSRDASTAMNAQAVKMIQDQSSKAVEASKAMPYINALDNIVKDPDFVRAIKGEQVGWFAPGEMARKLSGWFGNTGLDTGHTSFLNDLVGPNSSYIKENDAKGLAQALATKFAMAAAPHVGGNIDGFDEKSFNITGDPHSLGYKVDTLKSDTQSEIDADKQFNDLYTKQHGAGLTPRMLSDIREQISKSKQMNLIPGIQESAPTAAPRPGGEASRVAPAQPPVGSLNPRGNPVKAPEPTAPAKNYTWKLVNGKVVKVPNE